MGFFALEPEVAGGWGKNTTFTRTPGIPVVVHKLQYEFEGWLGDEILETTPCFIVTERLADEIRRRNLSGAEFGEVEVTKSAQFRLFHPERKLPKFVRLLPGPNPGRDDFGLGADLILVVSEAALALLRESGISNAGSVKPYEGRRPA
jgi:hypothetical protein